MTGRHAITREAALNSVNTPAGRGLIAAMAVGTAFGVTMPAANAAEGTTELNDAAVLTVKSDAADADAAEASTTAVSSPEDVEWGTRDNIAVENENAIGVDAQVEIEEEPEPAVEEEPVAETEATETAAADTETTTAAADTAAASSSQSSATETASVSSSVSSSAIVNTAMSYVGARYVWGGTTPAGWDCIGFVRYVFAQHGVSIGGYTTSVLSAGTTVPYSQAQPGDILYWPGHVAISVGNGQNVAAWNPSMGTKVGSDADGGAGTPTVIRVG